MFMMKYWKILWALCIFVTFLGFVYYSSYCTVEHNQLPYAGGTTKASKRDVETTATKTYFAKPAIRIVLLLAQTRSGSSFVGETFNQYKGVSYFYEPLFPFGSCPRSSDGFDVVEYFRLINNFDFARIKDLYREAMKTSGRSKDPCTKFGICFNDCGKCARFLSRDARMCFFANGSNKCPSPFDLPKLSNYVRNSKLLALKIVNLCDLKWIEHLFNHSRFDIKIVHLVRDPRAILTSKIRASSKADNETNNRLFAIGQCAHGETLVQYADRHLIYDKKLYMRVRHEDVSLQPVKWTSKIYDFVGLKMTDDIMRWLQMATAATVVKESTNLFGTIRNSSDVVTKWRTRLSYRDTRVVQSQCPHYMKSSNYVVFNNESSLRDLGQSSF